MLTRFRAYLSHHVQAAVSSLNFLCRKPLSTTMTIIVIAITLALPSLFWVFTANVEKLTVNWKKGGHISLYLKPISPEQELSILTSIKEIPGVGTVDLKSPAQGLSELQQQEGMEDIMQYLPENPLPAVIEVVPAVSVDSSTKLEQLFNQLKVQPHVEQAKLDMEWINKLHAILGFARSISHGVVILLASAVVLIIGNTLRLAIHNRYEEIQVLKLIGATDPFITRPFLYSGIWYGLAGAIVAILLVNIFMLSLAIAADQIASAYQMHYPLLGLSFSQGFLLIASAIILGWLGARLSVKRQLASIEPYN